MAAALIHCKTRAFPNMTPPVLSEEIWLGVAGIHRADPEQDAAGGYVRVTPIDADRPSFSIVPMTGPLDPLSVIVWWLTVAAQTGTATGVL